MIRMQHFSCGGLFFASHVGEPAEGGTNSGAAARAPVGRTKAKARQSAAAARSGDGWACFTTPSTVCMHIRSNHEPQV